MMNAWSVGPGSGVVGEHHLQEVHDPLLAHTTTRQPELREGGGPPTTQSKHLGRVCGQYELNILTMFLEQKSGSVVKHDVGCPWRKTQSDGVVCPIQSRVRRNNG
jgi:hypothetical protein